MLRTFTNYKQNDWDRYLPLVEFAYNNSIQASTGITPFFANYGQHPNIPTTLLQRGGSIEEESTVAATEEFINTASNVIKVIRDRLKIAQDKQEKNANKRRSDDSFNKGDKVLINTHLLTPAYDQQRPSKKTNSEFIGPFEIEEVISPTAYKLQFPPTMNIHPVVNISWLKRYHENKMEERIQPPPPPIETSEDILEYEVEKVLDMRQRKRGRRTIREFLIKWKGYPNHGSTWEPEKHLKNAKEAIQEFLRDKKRDEDVAF
jgi:hypothetical protein